MNLSLLILTYNEMIHMNRVLEKASLFDEVVIVDSNSNDGTYEFVKNFSKNKDNIHLLNNLYISQSKQLQWVLKNFQFKNDFIFKLDADEIISEELIAELQKIFTKKKLLYDGYSINRNIIFFGKLLKWGGVNKLPVTRIFHKNKFQIENRSMDEHIFVNNLSHIDKGYIVDDNLKNIDFYLQKHLKYANNESDEINNYFFKKFKSSMPRKVYFKKIIKYKIFYKLPPILRSILIFIYRYIFLGGFLDGKYGFLFHFLNSFIYRSLVDIFIIFKNKK